MSTCKYCGAPEDHRPYAGRKDMPSVTTVVELLDHGGRSRSFAWSAALIAACTAVHHPELWEGLGREGCQETKETLCPACRFLRSEHDRRWKDKANHGGHVHHLALEWAQGKDVEVDARTAPYMDALEAFYRDAGPEWDLLEATILHDKPERQAYRGQFDCLGTLSCPAHDGARCSWLIDLKTGGYYPVSQSLQLSAYRMAEWLTDWSDSDERKDAKMPHVAHAGVLLLDPEGYRLVELPANGTTFNNFLAFREAWGWLRHDMEPWDRGHPLPPPIALQLEEAIA